MLQLNDNANRTIQIVLNESDLEEALRNVISEFLAEQKQNTLDALLSRSAVRDRLHVDDSTLWRWDKVGYLKAVRIGRAVYYHESDVQEIEGGCRHE